MELGDVLGAHLLHLYISIVYSNTGVKIQSGNPIRIVFETLKLTF